VGAQNAPSHEIERGSEEPDPLRHLAEPLSEGLGPVLGIQPLLAEEGGCPTLQAHATAVAPELLAGLGLEVEAPRVLVAVDGEVLKLDPVAAVGDDRLVVDGPGAGMALGQHGCTSGKNPINNPLGIHDRKLGGLIRQV